MLYGIMYGHQHLTYLPWKCMSKLFSEKAWLKNTLPTYSSDICPNFRSFFWTLPLAENAAYSHHHFTDPLKVSNNFSGPMEKSVVDQLLTQLIHTCPIDSLNISYVVILRGTLRIDQWGPTKRCDRLKGSLVNIKDGSCQRYFFSCVSSSITLNFTNILTDT